MEKKGIEVNFDEKPADKCANKPQGCPGASVIDFSDEKKSNIEESGTRNSQLRQWPIQFHLVPPNAPYLQGEDVLLVADCVAYSLADFHKDYLKGKSIAIACPKLDSNQDIYEEKLKPNFTAFYDETGSIGRRYRRADEIGIPFCITVDFDTVKSNLVTIRSRDTMKQDQIKINQIVDYLNDKLK